MNELALFAGAGGGILGGHLLGWTTVCAVELEKYPREVLLQRQRDGILPPFPVWDDVCTFDGPPWRGLVDVVSGGFPCQDISCAGRGAGIEGARSGLWSQMFRIICDVRPRFAFMENSPMLTSRGLGVVLGDLAEIGYNAAWLVLGASDVGAPHCRKRIWILALDSNAYRMQCPQRGGEHPRAQEPAGSGPYKLASWPEMAHADGSGRYAQQYEAGESGETLGAPPEQQPSRASRCERIIPDTDLPGRQEQRRTEPEKTEHSALKCGCWWRTEPAVGRVANGVASRVDRLKAIGNGQVPLVAATAFETLKNILLHENLHH